MNPVTQSCGAISSELPSESRQIRLSRSGGGPADVPSGASRRGPSRRTRPPTAAPAMQAMPIAMKPQRTPPALTIGGSPSAIAKPLSGIAVCRIASARPRCAGSNQCMTARPLADCTLAPRQPGERNQPAERPEPVHLAARRSARRRSSERPTTSTSRSPIRSVRRPQRNEREERADERGRDQDARLRRATGGRGRAAPAPSPRRRTDRRVRRLRGRPRGEDGPPVRAAGYSPNGFVGRVPV